MVTPEAAWLSEAIVEFLKGPMYINPLMSFIDEKCLIFTPEEENKFEYTISHNEFKELVDKLLTEFLEDLGVTAEKFYEVVAQAQQSDQLTSFVVQTILTVDDFLMFKAMMVRRNIDLTNQVLEAVEASQAKGRGGAGGDAYRVGGSGPSITSKATGNAGEEEALKEAMAISNRLHAEWQEADRLQKAMRALQLEDEDPAMALAIAASLRDQAARDAELADIEQAIALSLALDEERRRLAALAEKSGAGAAAGAAGSAAAGRAASASAGAGAGAGAGAAPAAGVAVAAGAAGSAGAKAEGEAYPVIAKAAPSLNPLKGPIPGAHGAAPPPSAPAPAPPSAAPEAPRPQRFMPAPIDAPTGAMLGKSASVRNRAAGFKGDASGAVDLEAIRKAAQQAAESQKKLVGRGQQDDEASRWLQEAKKKLIAQKQAEREQEMADYQQKAAGKPKGPAPPAAAASADDAKRAALREALAQKMKQNIMAQG